MKRLTAGTRDFLSKKLLLPFSRIRRSVNPSLRPVMRAYYDGLRFRRQSAGWPPDKRCEWILNRLRFAVRRAYRETTYYRELFDGIGFDAESNFAFDEFAALPVLEREDVQAAGENLRSNRLGIDQLRKDSTGGSSGKPTEVWLGPEERGWRASAGEYYMQLMSVPAGTRTAFLWGHHLDPQAPDTLRERYQAFETNTRYFECFRLSADLLDRYHHQFERWRPGCIVAYASALGHLAEHILERGYRPAYPTGCLISGAEKLLPHHREAAEKAFGRPIHERYGSRDCGYLAFQLEPHRTRSYAVDWANVLIEPETNAPESSILVTKLHADGMPLLRYRIEDFGYFHSDAQPGHPAFSIKEIIGRSNDRIWLRDGRWVHGIKVPHMMKDYPVREYQFLQRADFSIDIRIVPKHEFSKTDEDSIAAIVRANLPGLTIGITKVNEIARTPSNKWRPVISEVAQSRGVAA